MSVLLLQTGDRLLLQSGAGGLLLQLADPGQPPSGGWGLDFTAGVWMVRPTPGVWRADDVATFAGYEEKTPAELLWLVFDFGNLPDLRVPGVSITTVAIPAVAGLGITAVQLEPNGYRVGAWYGGGTDGSDYDVTCTVTLSNTAVRSRTGTLQVRSKSQ